MKRWQADLTLGGVALIWGSTFVVVQNALDDVAPLTFVGFRFTFATLVLAALFAPRVRRMTRREALSGALIGVWLAGGYIFQTIGLQSTTTAKAGFITGLSVVIVPLLATVLLPPPAGRAPTVGILAATVGLAFLSLDRNLRMQSGDLWVLACAVMFALHIVSVAHFSPQSDAVRLTVAQIGTVAVLALLGSQVFRDAPPDVAPGGLGGHRLHRRGGDSAGLHPAGLCAALHHAHAYGLALQPGAGLRGLLRLVVGQRDARPQGIARLRADPGGDARG